MCASISFYLPTWKYGLHTAFGILRIHVVCIHFLSSCFKPPHISHLPRPNERSDSGDRIARICLIKRHLGYYPSIVDLPPG